MFSRKFRATMRLIFSNKDTVRQATDTIDVTTYHKDHNQRISKESHQFGGVLKLYDRCRVQNILYSFCSGTFDIVLTRVSCFEHMRVRGLSISTYHVSESVTKVPSRATR